MRALRVPALVLAAVTAGVLCAGSAAASPQPTVTQPTVTQTVTQPTSPQPAVAAAAPAFADAVAAVPVEGPAVVAAAPVQAPAATSAAPPRAAAPKPAVAAAPALAPGTPCAATARACVDISARKAWLISGGTVSYGPVPITTGRAGFRTPTGTYRVQFKDIDHKSSIFDDAPMPYSVFFNGGVAFHQGSLKVLSHGCVHLSAAAARTYFSSLKVGDVVQVRP